MRENAPSASTARVGAAILLFASALAFATIAEAADRINCKAKRTREICTSTSPGTNEAPTISGTPPATVMSGQSYAFAPSATDPDGDTLSFSIVNRPPWASFSASTGRLSGTPASSAAGEYGMIGITVSDGKIQTSLASFSITVTESNRAPSITGTPPTTAREGQAYEFLPVASDADGDALTFSIANRPSWANFNATTGVLRGTPPSGSVGSYSGIAIRVSDGAVSVTLPNFSIVVQQASTGSATLSWLPPTMRVDGSPLLGLAGYRIRYGTSLGSYPNTLVVPNGGVTSAVIGNLPSATYYFVISAYDSVGLESDNSQVVSKKII